MVIEQSMLNQKDLYTRWILVNAFVLITDCGQSSFSTCVKRRAQIK